MIPANSSKVFRKARQQFVRNELRAIFGAEHQVNENIRIFMGHPAKYSRFVNRCL